MIYCKKCTNPRIAVNLSMSDDMICSACVVNEEKKDQINWEERKDIFKKLLSKYKSNDKYDCIVPVSGGKDSHFQAHLIREMGFNPLLVTYYTYNYTETGEENLKNLRELGFDHYIFYPNKKVIEKMNKVGFEMLGDMSWHFHCGVYTVPFQVGVKFKIPLVIYGEHSLDLHGKFSFFDFAEFTKKERAEDVCRGYTEKDFIGKEGLTKKDLNWTLFPSDKEIQEVGLRGIFMGNYIYWDANKNLEIAKQIGFKVSPKSYARTYRKFSNVDDIHENGIKDYLKFIKFGYGRCTDHTSKDIRLGIMSREKGIELVRKHDHLKDKESLDHFLKMAKMTEDQFDLIADKFRDNRVWWIEKNKWYKNTIWGEPECYGDVKLNKEDQKKYKTSRIS
jgi:N-acetyl sugar amidotransferase|tara:strand:- start:4139 stop:5311 length:1173 start_codon:yes stop_codon:yes gene_type:complete